MANQEKIIDVNEEKILEIKNKSKELKKEIPREIKKLKEKLEKSEKLAEERVNQLKYLQADIENLGKRFEKEKQGVIKLANEILIKELLVILDDFDAAIKISAEGKNKEGLLMLKNKFFDMLVNSGLKEIEAIGKKFNPDFHEALCKEFSKKQDNEIIEIIQKGYSLDSKIIRTSKVKVSKGLKKEDESKED